MDKTALEQIVTAYQDGLYRFAFFRTGSEDDAKDIVQNVFVNMYYSCRVATVKNIKAYLYKGVKNACLNLQRDSIRQPTSNSLEVHDTPDESPPCTLLKEQYKIIESLLHRLPQDQAEVIRLRIVDELTFAEIAALLEEPPTTVKSRFKYGIDKLKRILKSKECYHEMF